MKLLTLLILSFIITGCTGSRPEVHVVTKTELKPIDLPDMLLRPCDVTPPPSKEDYMESTFEKKGRIINRIYNWID